MIYAYISKDENREKLMKTLSSFQVVEFGDECLKLTMKEIKERESNVCLDNTYPTLLFVSNESIESIQHINDYLVAMETETNVNWVFEDLMQEILKEAYSFQLRDQIMSMLKNPDMNRIESDPKYVNALSSIYAYMKSHECEIIELEQILKMLQSI